MYPGTNGRLRAGTWHLFISACVAGAAAAVVFFVWYPYPYREISGGRELFLLLVSVDVALGPLLTLVVFNPRKKWRELALDLAVVAVFQVAALAYGLWTVASARPVHLVFEIDRFRVVHAVDVPNELLQFSPNGIIALPWTGPTMVSVRKFKDLQESSDMTLAALQGVALAFRPELWQSYELGLNEVKSAAKPLQQIRRRYPQYENIISHAVLQSGYLPDKLAVLPLVARGTFWSVLIDSGTGGIVATLPVDTFE
jgi:hypothetical protein